MKSFIIHKDSLSVLDELTDEQAGKLFKAISNYQNGIETELDFGLKMAFLPFKNQFSRDVLAYEKKVERNKINGSKGGRPKNEQFIENPEKPKKPSGLFGNPEKPKKAYNKNKSKSNSNNKENTIPSIIDIENYFEANGYKKEAALKFYQYYNTKFWKDKDGNDVKNWKNKAQNVWFRDENKLLSEYPSEWSDKFIEFYKQYPDGEFYQGGKIFKSYKTMSSYNVKTGLSIPIY